MTSPQRIAVVGSGIAGLACAHLLDRANEVVLFEADDRLGGHANTVTVEDPAAGPVGVDTGFIVHNDRNYPNLLRLLDRLDVATIDSEMSFAVTDRPTGFTYRATSLNTLLADRRNLIDRRLWRMVADIARFYRNARRILADDSEAMADVTIGDILSEGRYSDAFVDLHLVPMGAAVWSADPATFDGFPAIPLLRFLDNHGLLSVGDRPQWRTIEGGSRTYVDAIAARFDGKIRLSSPVEAVERTGDGVVVRTAAGSERFDEVVLATHSDQALAALDPPTEAERDILGAIRYQPNKATLHTDTSLLPPKSKAWAAWNYDRLGPAGNEGGAGAAGRATLTYDLTLLQRLPGARRYLVSLNSDERIDDASVIARFDYAHPVFDLGAMAAQRRLEEVNGADHVWFCGAWQGYGFHEDGLVSALHVARRLGAAW